LLNRRRIHPEFPVEELDPTLVLRASVDQHFFFLALRLKRRHRHLAVQHDGNDRRKNEDDQQRGAALGIPSPSR
jgi:hypothetical protein